MVNVPQIGVQNNKSDYSRRVISRYARKGVRMINLTDGIWPGLFKI